MLEELVALAKIADVDAQARKQDEELEDIPARMTGLDADVKQLGELLEAERQELKEADALLSAQQEEIQGQNDALSRSKSKSARARNMREADAVERELEVIRRTMKEREAERESLRAAIETRRASVEKHEQEFAELEKFCSEEKAKSQDRIEALKKQRELVLAGRGELVTKVPADVVRRYDMIRKKRAGIGVVPVASDGCSGCHVALPPNQIIAVHRGETFEQCPRCMRILYSPATIAKYEAEHGVVGSPAVPEAAVEEPAAEQPAQTEEASAPTEESAAPAESPAATDN